MTTIQLALIAGAITALGLAIIVYRLIPADPELSTFLTNLSPTQSTTSSLQQVDPTGTGVTDRIGLWIMRTLPTGWLAPSRADLAMLRKPLHSFYGEKVTFGLVGLVLPLALSAIVAIIGGLTGFSLPLYIPIGASLLTAIGFSFIPDYNVRTDAADARKAFRQALAVYIDLVSMQRRGNAQPRQAMESAATIADSWVLQRLKEVLIRSRVTGDFPWDALTDLGNEIALSELVEIADIMRLAGDDQVAIYNQLRSKASAMRDALRAEDLADANAAGVRLWMPTVILGLIFIVILGVPVLIRLLTTL